MKPEIQHGWSGRRAVGAAGLLAWFLLLLLVPLAAAASDGSALLPICCRAHGRHDCSRGTMPGMADEAAHGAAHGTPVLVSPPERCPYAPALLLHADRADRLLPISGATPSPDLPTQPAHLFGTEIHRRSCLLRSRPNRGPPPSPLPI